MRLLFDEHLSYRLVSLLADIFPNSVHVSQTGLSNTTDFEIWEFAKKHSYIIATKDSDFNDLTALYGFPPHIIWIRRGNCSTEMIHQIIRINAEKIVEKFDSENPAIIELW